MALSMMQINDLHEKRRKCIADARAINDVAIKENRDLTSEEQNNYDIAFREAKRLKEQIDREVAIREEERREAQAELLGEGHRGDRQHGFSPNDAQEQRTLFSRYIQTGDSQARDEYRSQYGHVAADGEAGGYLLAPRQIYDQVLTDFDRDYPLLDLVKTITLTTLNGIELPIMEDSGQKAEWTTELSMGEMSKEVFGKRLLIPKKLVKWTLSSKSLLSGAKEFEAIILGRLRDYFAAALEEAFLWGEGDVGALGIMVESSEGVPKSQDVTIGELNGDAFIDAMYAMKARWRTNARWVLNGKVVREVSKFKDLNGQYIWGPGLAAKDPDQILGKPIAESERMPSTLASGKYFGAFCDLSAYWKGEYQLLGMDVLRELKYPSVIHAGAIWVDGKPVYPNAFIRLKKG